MFGGLLCNGIAFHDAFLALTALVNYSGNHLVSGPSLQAADEDLLPLTEEMELGTDDAPGAAIDWPGLWPGSRRLCCPSSPRRVGSSSPSLDFITIGAGDNHFG